MCWSASLSVMARSSQRDRWSGPVPSCSHSRQVELLVVFPQVACLRRAGDEVGADFLAEQARIEEQIVLVNVVRLAVEMGADEVTAALVAQADALGGLLARQAQPLAHVGDPRLQGSNDADVQCR